MNFALQILIQLLVLVTAMVIASLILRWIVAHPEKCKVAWNRTKRTFITPLVWMRATRAYFNWKKVKMKFTFNECLGIEWQKYDQKDNSDQPYYRL